MDGEYDASELQSGGPGSEFLFPPDKNSFCLKINIIDLEDYASAADQDAIYLLIEAREAGSTRIKRTRSLSVSISSPLVWNEEFELRFPQDVDIYTFTIRLVEHLMDDAVKEEAATFVDVDVRDSAFFECGVSILCSAESDLFLIKHLIGLPFVNPAARVNSAKDATDERCRQCGYGSR